MRGSTCGYRHEPGLRRRWGRYPRGSPLTTPSRAILARVPAGALLPAVLLYPQIALVGDTLPSKKETNLQTRRSARRVGKCDTPMIREPPGQHGVSENATRRKT